MRLADTDTHYSCQLKGLLIYSKVLALVKAANKTYSGDQIKRVGFKFLSRALHRTTIQHRGPDLTLISEISIAKFWECLPKDLVNEASLTNAVTLHKDV